MTFALRIGRLDRRDPKPLYLQLQRLIRSAIEDRTLDEGSVIPPERDLAIDYGVSRITVRNAMAALVEEGLLARRRGAGTVVTSRVEKNFAKLSSFSEDMAARGRVPSSAWITRASGIVTPEEAMALGLSPGAPVYRFHRLRYADDAPMALEFSTIVGYCLQSVDDVADSLYAALDAAGNRPARALQRLRAVPFGAPHARLLGVDVGSPGLLIERRAFLRDGRPAEFTQSYYRGDAYDFVAELTDFENVTSTDTSSLMRSETRESPDVVARMLDTNRSSFAALASALNAAPVHVVCTCARGSSDHAATYGKYLIETFLGVPVASVAPSVASVFDAPVRTRDALCIAVSQSGRSPDLLATVGAYRTAGLPLVAMVNDTASPLAAAADWPIPLAAGVEASVAATKSCIAAMAAMAALVAQWSGDAGLAHAVADLPEALSRAIDRDWSAAVEPLSRVERMFVIGRGYSLGIAQEAGLKLKETCAIQAEPFSAAEVRHGPMTIVGPGFPILTFATSDAAGADVIAVADLFAGRGAAVFDARAGGGGMLPAERAHPAIEPILMLASFYGLAEQLSRRRGLDPDAPPHLSKVTQTL